MTCLIENSFTSSFVLHVETIVKGGAILKKRSANYKKIKVLEKAHAHKSQTKSIL